MNNTPYILYSAINISKQKDAICIPRFLHYPNNETFIPVTDSNLKIRYFQTCDEFESRTYKLPDDCEVNYSYAVGDIVPLVIYDNGHYIIISEDTYEDLISELQILSNSHGGILLELLDDIVSICGSNVAVDHTEISDVEQEILANLEISPKNSTLWMDQVIENVRLIKSTGVDLDMQQTRLMRIQLLSWAQKLAEIASSRMFSHFVSSLSIVEESGLYLEDLYGSALLRRMSLDVPRKDRVIDLMRRFRIRYGRGPLRSVQELAENGVGDFKVKAEEVLEKYYNHVECELKTEKPYNILTAAFAADSSEQWPQRILSKLISVDEKFSAELKHKVQRHQNLVEEYASIREKRFEAVANPSKMPSKDLERARTLGTILLASSTDIKLRVEMLDVLKKVLTKSNHNEINSIMGTINYNRLELNEDLMTSILGTTIDDIEI